MKKPLRLRALGLVAVCLELVGNTPAWPQTNVLTQPYGVTSFDASSTIAVTNTFQSVFTAANNRNSCLVINTSGHEQYVFFGPIASATIAKSVPLEAATATAHLGGYASCTVGGVSLTDQVSITGTSGDTYVAKLQ